VKRQRAYEAIAGVYEDWGYGKLGWTPEVVAGTERRLAIDDADIWDSSVHFGDFALQVLDRLGVVEPYDRPGQLRSPAGNARGTYANTGASRGSVASARFRPRRSGSPRDRRE
jgi:hypothetical protein